MPDLNDTLEMLGLDNQLTLEDIPAIDLYMDQVIQLFEKKFSSSRRNEQEKVLTKTMINNYAKGKLFFPIKNKKYSKEHLILISLIYQLKGALSINDIKATLDGLSKKTAEGDIDLDTFYNSYLHLSNKNGERFKQDLHHRAKEATEEIGEINDSEYLEKTLLIASLVDISNLYRRAAEKLIDEITESKENKIK